MENFEFYNPTRIIFGEDRINELDRLIAKDARVMVLYGGGSVKRFGTLDKVLKALGSRDVVEFGGIEPNPKYETLKKAILTVKEQKLTYLLAVGGGSVIDGTKFIAQGVTYEGEPDELVNYRFGTIPVKTAIPFGTVLTLPATGSEMNSGAVVSFPEGKFPFFSQLVFPQFSILDPTLTYTLPKTQVANGIVDTFVHTVEQYVTTPSNAGFQDRTAEGILSTLFEIGKHTIENPTDYDSRANLVWCSTNALNGLIGAGVIHDWSVHMIGHELTDLFGIDHAKSLAIILPVVWDEMRESKKDKLLQYAGRVLGITQGSEDEIITQAIEKTRAFFEELGIKTRLSDYGITESDSKKVVEAIKNHGLTEIGESKLITPKVVEQILIKAL